MSIDARRFRILVVAGVAMALAGTACRHQAQPLDAAGGAPENMRGVVSITGTSFEQQIQLRTVNGFTRLLAPPADSVALSRLGGVEIDVHGTGDGNTVHVTSFTAVRAGGQPVVDGVLTADGNALVLQTRTGRVTLGNPPTALRQMIGARVWISGPLDAGPNSYGVIVPRP